MQFVRVLERGPLSKGAVPAFAVLLAAVLGVGVQRATAPADSDVALDADFVEEEVEVRHGEIVLAGTLSLPTGVVPFPAVISITGAGAQDRDGGRTDPLEIRAAPSSMAQRGLALLRLDDRGTGGSNGNNDEASLEDLVADIAAAVDFLHRDPRIEANRVGLLGASLGGIVAAQLAARRSDIAFVVLYSVPVLPAREQLLEQNAALLRVDGLPEETVERVVEQLAEGLRWIEADVPESERRQRLRPLIEEMRRLQRQSPFDAVSERSIDVEIDAITSRGFRSQLAVDPRDALRELKAPVLGLYGSLDLQVEPASNARALREALRLGGNEDATVEVLPRLNHLLQPAESGHPREYAQGRRSLEVLERTADWIAERVDGRGGGDR